MFNNFISRLYLSFVVSLCGFLTGSDVTMAQTTIPYSIVRGKVWDEILPANGVFNAGESVYAGFLVRMRTTTAPIRIIASAITDSNGNYTLNNFDGPGNYIIQLYFPNEAFIALFSPFSPGSQSHFTRYLGNTTASVEVIDSLQIDIRNAALIRDPTRLLSCRSIYSNVSPTLNSNIVLPKIDYTANGVSLWELSLWSATSSFHDSFIVKESLNIPSLSQIRIGIQATLNWPSVLPVTEMSSQSATSSIVNPFSGLEVKGYHNYNNSTVLPLSYLNYPPLTVGTDSITLSLNISNSVTLTSAMNFIVPTLPTFASLGACLVYYTSTPLTLISIESQMNDGGVELLWNTSAEKNTKGFEIEVSQDKINWSRIGFQVSKSEDGYSSNKLSYSFKHLRAHEDGTYFYRLKQIGYQDELICYSSIVAADR